MTRSSDDLDDPRDGTARRDKTTIPLRSLRVSVTSPVGPAPVEADIVTVGSASGNDVVIDEPTVSRFHLEVERQPSGILVRDVGSTNGTRIGSVHFRGAEVVVPPGTVIDAGGAKLLVDDGAKYSIRGQGPERFGALLGRSVGMRAATATLRQVAATEVSLLLTGESGTGKELAARAVHDHSARRERPFVTVDCGAISPTLFSSELFGHERGAFTGAERRHIGAFERAHGGTLFLDEIGELGADVQASLLGALERRRIRRVGGTADVDVDVRLISATHRNLRAMVNAERFRLDLFFRVAAVRVSLPPLRERPEDLSLLVQHLLSEQGQAERMAELFDAATMATLTRHDWPGNVRELRNLVLGALALGAPPPLEAEFPSASRDPLDHVLELDYALAKRTILDDFERRWLARVLARTRGNVRAASREGRIERKHLIDLLERHGLKPRSE